MSGNLGSILFLWPMLLIGGVLYFGRNFFPAWLKRRAEFGFDKEIEKLRGEVTSSEARLRAVLDAKQRELDSLREATFSGATSRTVALEARRLKAAEEIWNAVFDLRILKFAAHTAGGLKLAAVARRVNTDPTMKQFMDTMTQSIPFDKLPGQEAMKHRPFITDSVWASYSAFSTILTLAATRLKMTQLGMADADELLKVDFSNKVIATALPHQKEFIETHGVDGYHLLIDELEELVLSDIKNMLEGKEADAAAVRRNAELLKAVNEAQASAQSAISETTKSQAT